MPSQDDTKDQNQQNKFKHSTLCYITITSGNDYMTELVNGVNSQIRTGRISPRPDCRASRPGSVGSPASRLQRHRPAPQTAGQVCSLPWRQNLIKPFKACPISQRFSRLFRGNSKTFSRELKNFFEGTQRLFRAILYYYDLVWCFRAICVVLQKLMIRLKKLLLVTLIIPALFKAMKMFT